MTDEEARRALYDQAGSKGVDWGESSRPASGRRPRLESMVSVRFSPEEIERVRAAAEADGETVSSYIRAAVLSRATPTTQRPHLFGSYSRNDLALGEHRPDLTFLQSTTETAETGGSGVTTLPVAV